MKNLEQLTKENNLLSDSETDVISIGLNMQCNEVITESVLYKEAGKWCLSVDGIDIYCSNLKGLFLNTKENRKELENIMNK